MNKTGVVTKRALVVDQIIQGDCVEVLKSLPDKSVDLVFADPPYNLQLQSDLMRPNQTLVDAVNDEWDKFASLDVYDQFTQAWLMECRRVLKDEGAIWVIGSYHNIFRVGAIMMDCGYWILNDVVWHKINPMPNFRGTRFTNATETLIWAQKSQTQKRYTFNYHFMKNINDEKQMQNVWQIPLCTGAERIKINGKKAHSTQKPEALLYRVISSSTKVGDIILDPFFGSGTTGAVAKKLKRHYVGIERESLYIEVATQRIASIPPALFEDDLLITPSKRSQPRVSFSVLIESGYVAIGQHLISKDHKHEAVVHADGTLSSGKISGSIHSVAATLLGQSAYNGWDYWYVENEHQKLISIDELREKFRLETELPIEAT